MIKAIQIDNRQRALRFPRQLSENMRRCADGTLARFGLNECCEAAVSLVSRGAIRQLNAQYRGIDSVTDVLSFPAIDWQKGKAGRIDTLTEQPDKNPETGRIMLGDILICYAKALEQAEDYGHSPVRELCFLTVHGMLHLLGFDHSTKADEQWMQTETELILSNLDIVRPNQVVQSHEK